jgi:hypothetical protein
MPRSRVQRGTPGPGSQGDAGAGQPPLSSSPGRAAANGPDKSGASRRGPARGAAGGSANEAGGEYRAGVAAWLVSLGLSGRGVEGLALSVAESVPELVSFETDHPVDDLGVRLNGGGRLFAQAKRSLTLGDSAFAKTVTQWIEAVAHEALDPTRDRLVLFTESDSAAVIALASALDRRRSTEPGRPTLDEQDALRSLDAMIQSLEPTKRAVLLDVAVVLRVKVLGHNAPDRAAAQTMLDVAVVDHGEGEAAFKALKEPAHMAAVGRYGRVLREWRNEIQGARLHLRENVGWRPVQSNGEPVLGF